MHLLGGRCPHMSFFIGGQILGGGGGGGGGGKCPADETDIFLMGFPMYSVGSFNSFLASGNFCHLLITFENSLDPDQDRQSVGPDLDPNYLTL